MLTPPQLPAMIPPGAAGSIENIIESIPTTKCYRPMERPLFVITGKPGSGKSALAKKIAETIKTELINPDTILSMILGATSIETDEEPSKGAFSQEVILITWMTFRIN
jgi:Cdc6-like AAA superfamily ATPase